MALSVVECSELWNCIGDEGSCDHSRLFGFVLLCDLAGPLSPYLCNEEYWAGSVLGVSSS